MSMKTNKHINETSKIPQFLEYEQLTRYCCALLVYKVFSCIHYSLLQIIQNCLEKS